MTPEIIKLLAEISARSARLAGYPWNLHMEDNDIWSLADDCIAFIDTGVDASLRDLFLDTWVETYREKGSSL